MLSGRCYASLGQKYGCKFLKSIKQKRKKEKKKTKEAEFARALEILLKAPELLQ